ncbi:MAG: type II toxin-antitoxin system YafQ family toxin [Salinivirgaceae bacterium]|nr:type II toxin-antitoxin system YafQ family toxin [Salinivirgaceae bacterium]
MKRLQPTTQYRKDLKRYRNQPKKLAALLEVTRMLENEQPIPAEYKPHPLHGEYEGCIECHVQGDFLLIWFDEEHDIIELVRVGSHSELFG